MITPFLICLKIPHTEISSMLKSGTPGRDGTRKKFRPVPAVPCFLVENTGQSRPGCVSENKGHWIVPSRRSRVFNEKTRDSRDGTIQCLRKHGTAGTGHSNVCLKIRDIGPKA